MKAQQTESAWSNLDREEIPSIGYNTESQSLQERAEQLEGLAQQLLEQAQELRNDVRQHQLAGSGRLSASSTGGHPTSQPSRSGEAAAVGGDSACNIFSELFPDSIYKHMGKLCDQTSFYMLSFFLVLQSGMYVGTALYSTRLLSVRPQEDNVDVIFMCLSITLATAVVSRDWVTMRQGNQLASKGHRLPARLVYFEALMFLKTSSAVFCSYCIITRSSGEALDMLADCVAIVFIDDLDELMWSYHHHQAAFVLVLLSGAIVLPGIALGISMHSMRVLDLASMKYIGWVISVCCILALYLKAYPYIIRNAVTAVFGTRRTVPEPV